MRHTGIWRSPFQTGPQGGQPGANLSLQVDMPQQDEAAADRYRDGRAVDHKCDNPPAASVPKLWHDESADET